MYSDNEWKVNIAFFAIKIFFVCIIIIPICNTPKCISTEYQEVTVEIVDAYHKGAWIQMMPTGKSIVTVPHAAKYEITVQYEENKYTINDKDVYAKYWDKIGHQTSAIMEVKTYEDESIEYNIQTLKE